jgi:hypothetical protein
MASCNPTTLNQETTVGKSFLWKKDNKEVDQTIDPTCQVTIKGKPPNENTLTEGHSYPSHSADVMEDWQVLETIVEWVDVDEKKT